MGYKILGFVVWKGAQWYVRRRVGRMMPSRRVASAALVTGVVATIALVAAKRNGSSDS